MNPTQLQGLGSKIIEGIVKGRLFNADCAVEKEAHPTLTIFSSGAAEQIEAIVAAHLDQWQPFTGEYEKGHYDVLLPDGTIIKHCWPNNGKMMATDGSGLAWDCYNPVLVRPSKNHPMD